MRIATDVPIVLVHGWAGSSVPWAPVTRALTASGHRAPVTAIDLPGSPLFRGSAVAPTISDATRHLVETLEGIGRPALLVGHSLGAQVTLLAHAERPDLVHAEVVLDPAYNSTEPRAALANWADRIERDGHAALRPFFAEALGNRVPASSAAQVLADLRATPVPVIVSYLRSEYLDPDAIGLRPQTLQAAGGRRHPVLALHTRASGAELEKTLPAPHGSRTVLRPGANHFLHLEGPEGIVDEIQSWLSRLDQLAGTTLAS
ncbi:MAG TPA: alpha/beta hydrolase [Arachnia sp.]|nr:alpha/beta hydrolase [Arachnia sp.]HMT85649.1 alpha/beta hydrolase [Arachnia sp.]